MIAPGKELVLRVRRDFSNGTYLCRNDANTESWWHESVGESPRGAVDAWFKLVAEWGVGEHASRVVEEP